MLPDGPAPGEADAARGPVMTWLNYHHLLYFFTVAREGSVMRAAEALNLTQSTISGQIKMLEEALDERLFERQGRRLVLTEVGRVVYQYAEDIFSLGRELLDTLDDRPTGRPFRLVVGVADQVPKNLVHGLLSPALALPQGVHVVCREGKTDALLADLSVHQLDVVLADAPMRAGMSGRAFNHLLGDSGVSFLAAPPLARRLRRRFPESLDGAPMLMPTDAAAVRRALDQWFADRRIRPRVVAEIEDSAVLSAFGKEGVGVFPAPTVVERAVRRQYQVAVVGRADDVRERFYAISIEKKLKHPAVVAITEGATQGVFR
jgi:LysR family transcriptional activator of nhaA